LWGNTTQSALKNSKVNFLDLETSRRQRWE
jgi:hypothetical protein